MESGVSEEEGRTYKFAFEPIATALPRHRNAILSQSCTIHSVSYVSSAIVDSARRAISVAMKAALLGA